MLKNRIVRAIKEVMDADHGFEIYIAMKTGTPPCKRFVVEEGDPVENKGFKKRLHDSIMQTIQSTYLAADSQYASGEEFANEQERFYVIEQNEEYHPLRSYNIMGQQVDNFRLTDKSDADALLFQFIVQRDGVAKQIWAYQKIQPTAFPNRQRKGFQLVPKSQQPDVFREMKDQMFIITPKVDLILLDDAIITDEVKLMERHFRLETFWRASANRAAASIAALELVENEEKLRDYAQRKDKRYAKKMMQIHKFPVASMEKEMLLAKLQTVERWKNVFEVQGGQIYLRSYADVERLIDLFTERYTKSEVTGQEYDTAVKDKAAPVGS